MVIGILLFLIFLLIALLMYLNKLPALLALPIMAVLLILVAGIPYYYWAQILHQPLLLELLTKSDPQGKEALSSALILTEGKFLPSLLATLKDTLTIVLSEGAFRLHIAIFTVLFGAILAQIISKSGIAETLIKSAAELAGDKPFAIGLTLTLVIALLFTVLGGLGAVIMVATIVFPIMLSIGLSPMLVGCLFLLGLSLGGTFNLANWVLYKEVLGLSQSDVFKFASLLGVVFFIIILIFLFVELRRSSTFTHWSVSNKEKESERVAGIALLTPLIPLVLVLGFQIYNLGVSKDKQFVFPIIPAMIIGIVFGVLTTRKRGVSSINILTKSCFEGIADVAPAIILMLGIGMLLKSVTSYPVASFMAPLLRRVMPESGLTYIAFFVILAPLALYRGPFNLWGMGSGLVGIMLATKSLPPVTIMAALMSVGMIQGVCDPTNTHNVWIANYLSLDIQAILRKTLPYMWVLALLGLVIAGVRYF